MAKIYYGESTIADKNGKFILTRLEKASDVKASAEEQGFEVEFYMENDKNKILDNSYGIVEQVGNKELIFYEYDLTQMMEKQL